METYIIANVLIILGGTALGFFFGSEDSRVVSGFWVGWFLFALSVWCWVAYIVVHFVQKFW